jgi:hypothetical protein
MGDISIEITVCMCRVQYVDVGLLHPSQTIENQSNREFVLEQRELFQFSQLLWVSQHYTN